ncbi:hypothetical protein ACQ86N_29360 [Puia sp. P3]|uniref:hypothetical protein n=1 Tax=Puia sp. P3 TaxID=3423952 RepID=UPI003D674267
MTRTDEIFEKTNTMGYFEQLADIKYQEGVQIGKEEGIQEGKIEGIQEGREQVARSLVSNTDFAAKKIAGLAGVPLSFVRKLKAGSGKK